MAYKEGQLIGSTSIVDKIGEVLTIVCFLPSLTRANSIIIV